MSASHVKALDIKKGKEKWAKSGNREQEEISTCILPIDTLGKSTSAGVSKVICPFT